ncbi:copia protein [Phtheirospermum japonicum]|uniref:Copia protein n=1 Tax=Phtheirospermum japonicum TaxID=374723 RepID=A0A830CUJ2_9LAMI|nr:copia protein [Phtheirospermum japonicum]
MPLLMLFGLPYSYWNFTLILPLRRHYFVTIKVLFFYLKITVSQLQANPTVEHFSAVKRILRYVNGTIDFGVNFSGGSSSIMVYSDADWARCLDTRRSTYGYSIFFGPKLVSWSAKKQPTVSRSSCESEYRALANAASEVIWVTLLLRELHVDPTSTPSLFCDNKSALFLSQNPIAHKRAKHIDIDYHFVRELVSAGRLATQFVPSNLQVADIFTKALPRSLFICARQNGNRVRNISQSLSSLIAQTMTSATRRSARNYGGPEAAIPKRSGGNQAKEPVFPSKGFRNRIVDDFALRLYAPFYAFIFDLLYGILRYQLAMY